MLTTRELIWMIKCYGIDFTTLPPTASSTPRWALASGAGDIFGTTGGVMEATLRAASELVTGKPADRLEFTEVRAVEGLRETYVAIGDHNIHVGVANGLTNAKILLDKVEGRQGAVPRDRGDGLSRRLHRRRRPALSARGRQGARSRALLRKRARRLYTIDSGKTLRKSYENPAIEEALRRVPRRARLATRPTNCCTPTTRPKLPRGIR